MSFKNPDRLKKKKNKVLKIILAPKISNKATEEEKQKQKKKKNKVLKIILAPKISNKTTEEEKPKKKS